MNEPLRPGVAGAICAIILSMSVPLGAAPVAGPAPSLRSIPVVKVGSPAPQSAPVVAPAPRPVPIDPWAWTTSPLTGYNAPYAKARTQIDEAIAEGRPAQDLLTKYRAAAQSAPGDPLALFRWAYTAYDAAALDTSPANVRQSTAGLSDARYAIEPVTAYDFNRVRFLIATLIAPSPQLADMGRRLLDVTPNDPLVEYALAGILLDAYKPPKTIEALGLADDLLQNEPNRAEPYALVGQIYYYRWKAHGLTADGIQARDAYRKYAEFASDDDSFKSRAASLAQAISDKLGAAGISSASP